MAPPDWTEGPKPDWLCLPQEVLATIFLKLGAVEIIKSAEKVCTLWRSFSLDPSLWKHIHMRNGRYLENPWYELEDHTRCDLNLVCRVAVDRSCGGCVDISIEGFGDNHLLSYIVDSGCQLRRLRLFLCSNVSDKGLRMAAPYLPLLETFEVYYSYLTEKALVAIGQNCPNLTTLKFIKGRSRRRRKDLDKEAFAIAKYMPGLRHLTLLGIKLTNTGLEAILDDCPLLESLDLRQCYNIDLRGDIAKRCRPIKNLKHPMDPFDGYGFDSSMEDDYEEYCRNSSSSDDWLDFYDHYSPPPPPRNWTHGRKPNSWLALPRQVLSRILLKLGAIEIIESAQKVCTLWRSVCKDPSMWTNIDMRNFGVLAETPYSLEKMCCHAIDRSRGGCVDINIENFGDDELMNYIVDSGCRVRRFRLICSWDVSNDGIAKAVSRLSSLETFECYGGFISEEGLIALGKNCPHLTSLRFERESIRQFDSATDGEAFAIAKSMLSLRHLSLFGNRLTNAGLEAILDGCHHLKSLDLRRCLYIDLKGDLARNVSGSNFLSVHRIPPLITNSSVLMGNLAIIPIPPMIHISITSRLLVCFDDLLEIFSSSLEIDFGWYLIGRATILHFGLLSGLAVSAQTIGLERMRCLSFLYGNCSLDLGFNARI